MTQPPATSSRFLVVSDLHIADLEDHADGWKIHKSSRYCIDLDFDALLEDFTHAGAGANALTLVLNGDIFDFDLVTAVPDHAPWPVARSERARGLLPTPEKSAWKLRRMLEDHPRLLRTLAKFLMQGHQVVYVLGNHDREFHFVEVQEALLDEIRRAAAEFGEPDERVAVQFEPWFYYVPGVIYAEHGQQYDYYSSFRFILSPEVLTADGREVALPMGNVSNRYLVSRMGFFNPHASDYILNVFHYAMHWLRHYALSRRSLAFNWLWGSILVIIRLLVLKKKSHTRPTNYDTLLEAMAQRIGLQRATLQALSKLHRPPITTRFYRIVREFWIDRVLISFAMILGTGALALMPVPLWVKLMIPLSVFPLVYFIYEWLARGETIFSVEHEVPKVAGKISTLLPANVVTFGHTHRPRLIPLAKNASFVDTGTWAPITVGERKTDLVPGYRNYLLVLCDSNGVHLTLGSWLETTPGIGSRT